MTWAHFWAFSIFILINTMQGNQTQMHLSISNGSFLKHVQAAARQRAQSFLGLEFLVRKEFLLCQQLHHHLTVTNNIEFTLINLTIQYRILKYSSYRWSFPIINYKECLPAQHKLMIRWGKNLWNHQLFLTHLSTNPNFQKNQGSRSNSTGT